MFYALTHTFLNNFQKWTIHNNTHHIHVESQDFLIFLTVWKYWDNFVEPLMSQYRVVKIMRLPLFLPRCQHVCQLSFIYWIEDCLCSHQARPHQYCSSFWYLKVSSTYRLFVGSTHFWSFKSAFSAAMRSVGEPKFWSYLKWGRNDKKFIVGKKSNMFFIRRCPGYSPLKLRVSECLPVWLTDG